jgi:hypothetical protein
MMARFFAGPYDGMDVELSTDVDKLNAACDVVFMAGEQGKANRQFLVMPGPKDWDRIAKGESTKDDCPPCHPYERRFVAGAVEYHYAAAWFADARRGR